MTMHSRRLAVALLLLPAAACFGEPKADVTSPKSFSAEGVTFSFPGNWKATSEVDRSTPEIAAQTIFVESPGNAIFMVSAFSPPIDMSLDDWVTIIVKGMQESIVDQGTIGGVGLMRVQGNTRTAVTQSVGGKSATGVRVEFAVDVVGEKVPHIATIFRVATDSTVAFIQAQAATEDWDKVRPGFELIQSSFALAGAAVPKAP